MQDIKPVGLEGSGGSTPLKLTVTDEDGRERTIFAKLYAKSHVRADRWYKLGRTMLYGRLEDETPFTTVRRFVEYEDYTLRMLGEYGFPTPAPLGIVEITPEREYLIAMDFFDDAVEIGEAEIDAHVIDEGLAMIRRMWDVGLAHRDIKPANLMVQRGELKLIDVFFVQVRPSPWRQAVDLGNMMLVLALRSDARTVYDAALRYFTPDELAEAFAATRGVASPTQLRQQMKQDGRDLLAEFRSMAPARRPIAVQRWSVRRVALIVASLGVLLLVALTGVGLFFPTRGTVTAPTCGTGQSMQLMAQAVPSATRLPCVAKPAGRMERRHRRDDPGQGELRRRCRRRFERARDGDPHRVLSGAGRRDRTDPDRRRLRDLPLDHRRRRTCRRSRRAAASPSRLVPISSPRLTPRTTRCCAARSPLRARRAIS